MRAEIYKWGPISQAAAGVFAFFALLGGCSAAWAQAPQKAAGFEIHLKQRFLSDLLQAAAPFERTREYEVGALGITRTVSYKVRLYDPQVVVEKGRIHVPMKFDASDGSGLISTTGTVDPDLTLSYDKESKQFVARLSKADLRIGGVGLTIPVEQLVDPMPIPGVMPADLELPHKKLVADVTIADIQIHEGAVHVLGDADFHEAKPKATPSP